MNDSNIIKEQIAFAPCQTSLNPVNPHKMDENRFDFDIADNSW